MLKESLITLTAVALLVPTACVRFKPIAAGPAPPTPPAPPIPAGISHVDVPLTISNVDLSVINQDVPGIFGQSQRGLIPGDDSDQVNYLFWRDPLSPSLSGATLQATVHPYFYLSIGDAYDPDVQCGYRHEPAQERLLQLTSQFSWASDWYVQSKTSWQFLAMNPPPPDCKLGVFNINATGLVNNVLTNFLNSNLPKFDESVRLKTDVKPKAEALWSLMRQTTSLGSGIWLQIRPNSASAAPLTSAGPGPPGVYTLLSVAEITGQPQLFFGAEPPPDSTPLPPLGATITGNNGFDLHADLTVSIEAAQSAIQRYFPVTLTFGRHQIVLCKPKLTAFGTKVLLEVELLSRLDKREVKVDDVATAVEWGVDGTLNSIDGFLWSSKGNAYFLATPSIDSDRRDVYFPDLDFSEDSRSLLIKTADWVLHTLVVESLRSSLRLNMGTQIDALYAKINAGINRQLGNLSLNGYTDLVRPDSAFVTQDGIVMRFESNGQLFITGNAAAF